MSEDPIEEIKRKKLAELQQNESAATPTEPVEITDRNQLEAFVSEHRIVLIDCYADWCGPCKQVKPIVEQIAAETPAAVAAIDIDRHSDLATEWNVRSTPTLLLYVDGGLAERLIGVQPFDRLASLINRHA